MLKEVLSIKVKMETETIYYKVLTLERKSIVAFDDLAITYPLLEWTKPKIPDSKLMVFDRKIYAIEFAARNSDKYNYMIVPCYIKKTYKNAFFPVLTMSYGMNKEIFKEFWKAVKESDYFEHESQMIPTKNKYNFAYNWAPWGTQFADEVYCLE